LLKINIYYVMDTDMIVAALDRAAAAKAA